jgi:hypothetical protein
VKYIDILPLPFGFSVSFRVRIEITATMLDVRQQSDPVKTDPTAPNPTPTAVDKDEDGEVGEGEGAGEASDADSDAPLCTDPETIWNNIWRHMSCYTLPSDDYTRWYLMDEVGSSITHSSDPNVRCCPLLVDMGPVTSTQGLQQERNVFALSLVWPIKKIAAGDMVTRDFLPNVSHDDPTRPLRLLAFSRDPATMLHSLKDRGSLGFAEVADSLSSASISVSIDSKPAAAADASGTGASPLPDWSDALQNIETIANGVNSLKVFCDRPDHLNPALIHRKDRIQLVDKPDDADVLYLIDHTCGPEDSDEEFAKRGKMINQFWWEGMVVSKEHLARTVRSAYIDGTGDGGEKLRSVSWCPLTYDCSIRYQLLGFVEDYIQAESEYSSSSEAKNKNIWIMKRYRGRQSMDYPVTTNLSCALRHLESAPRLACRYIHNPATYKGRKFDMRFYVLVYSLEPLVLRRHKMFVLRIANEQYTDSDFEHYQKHFTVMNYLDTDDGDAQPGDAHTHIPADSMAAIRGKGGRENPTVEQFIEVFDREHTGCTHQHTNSAADGRPVFSESSTSGSSVWHSVAQPAIDKMIRQVFEGVRLTYLQEPPHPSGQQLHPNAGEGYCTVLLTTSLTLCRILFYMYVCVHMQPYFSVLFVTSLYIYTDTPTNQQRYTSTL